MKFEWRPPRSQSALGKRDVADLFDEGGELRGVIFIDREDRLAFTRFHVRLNMTDIHTPPVKDLEEMKAWAMAHVLLS